jgi:subtilisin family serine protease
MVNGSNLRINLSFILFLLAPLPGGSNNSISGQEDGFYYYYRITFKDKGNYKISDFDAADLLSPAAISRRIKNGIDFPDYRDLPVNRDYIKAVRTMGLELHCTSRWMNSALFKSETEADINNILDFPFISEAKVVKHPGSKANHQDKLLFKTNGETASAYEPLQIVNGNKLKNSGFDGEGMVIAVLDGGFFNADKISSLENLRNRNGIIGTYNIVGNNTSVYDFHDHGTAVLSVLAGDIPGFLEGSAQGADYILIRTEDTSSEFPVEEDFWASGAELADSIGADIISSSLGYFNFDDPLMDYKYSDMNGDKTFVTQVADIAASKGILVVSSAGNERNKLWMRIIAPSDGDSVLAAGAVDMNRKISAFSSAGPSSDGRIKPDVSAPGVSVPVQTDVSNVESASGTSFSCPIISGICACIMQAVPSATNYDIIESVRSSSDRFLFPDSLYGYGIPDAVKALEILQDKFVTKPVSEIITGPNPFNDMLTVTFKNIPGDLSIEIFSLNGELVYRKDFDEYVSRSLTLNDTGKTGNGIYILRIRTNEGIFTKRLIRIKR